MIPEAFLPFVTGFLAGALITAVSITIIYAWGTAQGELSAED